MSPQIICGLVILALAGCHQGSARPVAAFDLRACPAPAPDTAELARIRNGQTPAIHITEVHQFRPGERVVFIIDDTARFIVRTRGGPPVADARDTSIVWLVGDAGRGMRDIGPEDVATVTVLSRLNAQQRARSCAVDSGIEITTKRAASESRP